MKPCSRTLRQYADTPSPQEPVPTTFELPECLTAHVTSRAASTQPTRMVFSCINCGGSAEDSNEEAGHAVRRMYTEIAEHVSNNADQINIVLPDGDEFAAYVEMQQNCTDRATKVIA